MLLQADNLRYIHCLIITITGRKCSYMNKKLAGRLILDFIMTVFMIILMGYAVSGALLHEILGITVLVLIAYHNIINIRWFASILKMKDRPQNYKIWIRLVINLLMCVNTLLLGISSIIISRSLFAALGIQSSWLWVYLHRATAYLELIMISIHVGMHWKMIMNAFRKMLRLKETNRLRTLILRILAFILAVLGVKASFDRGVALALMPPETGTSTESISLPDAPDNSGSSSTVSSSGQTDTSEDSGFTNTSFSQTRSGGHGRISEERDFSGTEIEEGETLNEFLGRLVCDGCSRRCPLLSPQCGIGREQAEQASDYYESYSSEDAATADDADTTEDASSIDGNSAAIAEDDASGESSSDDSSIDETLETDAQSLEEYLGSLVCDGCHKRCSLLSPQCGIGREQAAEATEYYESNIAGESSSDSSDSTDSTAEEESRISIEVDSSEDDSLLNLFTDFVPIMGLYIAGTYYTLEIIDKAKNKKSDTENNPK